MDTIIPPDVFRRQFPLRTFLTSIFASTGHSVQSCSQFVSVNCRQRETQKPTTVILLLYILPLSHVNIVYCGLTWPSKASTQHRRHRWRTVRHSHLTAAACVSGHHSLVCKCFVFMVSASITPWHGGNRPSRRLCVVVDGAVVGWHGCPVGAAATAPAHRRRLTASAAGRAHGLDGRQFLSCCYGLETLF